MLRLIFLLLRRTVPFRKMRRGGVSLVRVTRDNLSLEMTLDRDLSEIESILNNWVGNGGGGGGGIGCYFPLKVNGSGSLGDP